MHKKSLRTTSRPPPVPYRLAQAVAAPPPHAALRPPHLRPQAQNRLQALGHAQQQLGVRPGGAGVLRQSGVGAGNRRLANPPAGRRPGAVARSFPACPRARAQRWRGGGGARGPRQRVVAPIRGGPPCLHSGGQELQGLALLHAQYAGAGGCERQRAGELVQQLRHPLAGRCSRHGAACAQRLAGALPSAREGRNKRGGGTRPASDGVRHVTRLKGARRSRGPGLILASCARRSSVGAQMGSEGVGRACVRACDTAPLAHAR